MNAEFQQYRFARIEGHNITRARLEAQFKNGITDLDELEKAIAQQLTAAAYELCAVAQIRNRENRLPRGNADGGSGVLLVAPTRTTECRSDILSNTSGRLTRAQHYGFGK